MYGVLCPLLGHGLKQRCVGARVSAHEECKYEYEAHCLCGRGGTQRAVGCCSFVHACSFLESRQGLLLGPASQAKLTSRTRGCT